MKIFDQVQIERPGRNTFDLSHEKKLSCNMGDLIPILVQDVVPGDTFRMNTEILMRLKPLQAPMYQRCNITTHFYFVPNRIVWKEWEDKITGGDHGDLDPQWPTIQINNTTKPNFGIKSLADYMGIPTIDPAAAINNPKNISVLPFRAYQLIYDEYYRDQNLIEKIDCATTSGDQGPEADKLLTMRKRAWEHDYFTSCLPTPQKGGDVLIPVESAVQYKTAATVRMEGTPTNFTEGDPVEISDGSNYGQPLGEGTLFGNATDASKRGIAIENIEAVNNISATIRDLRVASRVQEWLEILSRAGSRYFEQIKAMFGVRSPDARLQRPEYLGGGQTHIVVSEVLSTYQNPDDSGYPQGTMAGHGIGVGQTNGFKASFVEHGYVIGIMSVLPKTSYQQGIPKHFQKLDKYDLLWPKFAQLGEQEVTGRELYYDPTAAAGDGDETFGYQSRYAEYKYQPSTVHGDFRESLAFWHQGRIFASKPLLNESFVTSDPTDRIFAVQDPDEDHLWVQLYHNIKAARPLPYFNNPKL